MLLRSLLLGWTALLACGFMATTACAQNNNNATTIQLPTFGVSVDADGELNWRSAPDPTGELRARRLAAAKAALPDDVGRVSKLRKVSLVRLEKALAENVGKGFGADAEMLHLAGLQRVEYIFLYPEENDIVLAGPAEGWVNDLAGRPVGITTGRPVVLLEDLIVALRAFPPESKHDVYLGCSIDPTAEGLARMQAFQRTVPAFVSDSQRAAVAAKVAHGARTALGPANIRVFGINNQTHFAKVLVEADFRMKLIGMGVEPPPTKMITFLEALSSAKHATLQRWWFTPKYDCVRLSEDRLAAQLVGQGVQLNSEDKLIGADGELAAPGRKANRASDMFTTSFTRNYEKISAVSPVYGQMRNAIDLTIAAAFLRQQHYGDFDWSLGVYADEAKFPVETHPEPKTVDCIVNAVWKGSRLFSPAGGVSIRPELALEESRLLADDRQTVSAAHHGAIKRETDNWWWD